MRKKHKHHESEPVSREERTLEQILEVEQRIAYDLEHQHHEHHHANRRTARIEIQFGDDTMNDVVLLVGQSTKGTIVPLEADGTTQTPGAVVSKQVASISDPSLTLTMNPDGTFTIAGVAPSTGPASGTCSATVTDADGAAADFTGSFTVTVNAPPPPPTGLTKSIAVSFSQPL